MKKVDETFCEWKECKYNARTTFNGKDYCDVHALQILQDIAGENVWLNFDILIEQLDEIGEQIVSGNPQTGLEMLNNVMLGLAIQNADRQNRL